MRSWETDSDRWGKNTYIDYEMIQKAGAFSVCSLFRGSVYGGRERRFTDVRGEWMREILQIATGLSIPFAGTTLGAAMVFLMKNEMNKKLEKLLLGFAAGVMIAASV